MLQLRRKLLFLIITRNIFFNNILKELFRVSECYFSIPQVEWPVSGAAKNASTPDRIELLSRPKERKEGPFCYPQWVVSKASRSAQASTRVQVSLLLRPFAKDFIFQIFKCILGVLVRVFCCCCCYHLNCSTFVLMFLLKSFELVTL